MRLLVPPATHDHLTWIHQITAQQGAPRETQCHGWGDLLLQAGEREPTTPGEASAKCQRCKTEQAFLDGVNRVGRVAEDP
eukprot:6708846-Heterocapsa_arctica.AAC.1